MKGSWIKKLQVVFLVSLLVSPLYPQLGFAQESVQVRNSLKVAEVGHSLIGVVIPRSLVYIAASKNKDLQMSVQVMSGSSIENNWINHKNAIEVDDVSNPSFGDVYEALKKSKHDVLVITDAIPYPYENSLKYMLLWRNYGVENGVSKVYFYIPWPGMGGQGAWKTIDTREKWRHASRVFGKIFEKLIEDANTKIQDGPKIEIIPANEAMLALDNATQNGRITWAKGGIDYFFQDEIHLNFIGSYYMSLVQYASIYKESPVGVALPRDIVKITDAQAEELQRLAWEVVSGYKPDATGASTSTLVDLFGGNTGTSETSLPKKLTIVLTVAIGVLMLYIYSRYKNRP